MLVLHIEGMSGRHSTIDDEIGGRLWLRPRSGLHLSFRPDLDALLQRSPTVTTRLRPLRPVMDRRGRDTEHEGGLVRLDLVPLQVRGEGLAPCHDFIFSESEGFVKGDHVCIQSL